MKDNPLVSVIIPVYNIDSYLRACMDSVCGQSYKNLQIIIVDDGSCDNSPMICDEYARTDNRAQVIHKVNGGLSSARNAGLDEAKGEYVYFVDGDDLINEKCIERMVAIQGSKDCDIVQCKTDCFIDIEKLSRKLPNNPEIEVFAGKEYCKMLMSGKLGTDGGVAWDKLYKKELFREVRFPEGMVYEDDATVFKLYWIAERVARTNEQLAYYRSKRTGSIMHSDKKHYHDMMRVRQIQREFFENKTENDLISQILYLTANDYATIRADKAFIKSGECISGIKRHHHEVMQSVVRRRITSIKKAVCILGFISPGTFLKIKQLKRYLTEE